MAADSPLTAPMPRVGDTEPPRTGDMKLARAGDTSPACAEAPPRPSFAELLLQDLPALPSLAALRALSDKELPSTDGRPMPEPMVQGRPLRYTVGALEWLYRRRRPGTCVAGDLLVYAEGRPEPGGRVRALTIAPDVLVAFGVGERDRDSYVIWKEGKAPDFVLEIASKSTWRQDRDEKPARYASLGVEEYFLYDPDGGRLEPRLQGYALHAGRYRALPGGRLGNGEWGVCSRVLGVCAWLRGPRGELRWYDPETGKDLKDLGEAEERAEAAEERAEAAEAELAELRAQVRQLRGESGM